MVNVDWVGSACSFMVHFIYLHALVSGCHRAFQPFVTFWVVFSTMQPLEPPRFLVPSLPKGEAENLRGLLGSPNAPPALVRDGSVFSYCVMYIRGLFPAYLASLFREKIIKKKLFYCLSFGGYISGALGAINFPQELPNSPLRVDVVWVVSSVTQSIGRVTNLLYYLQTCYRRYGPNLRKSGTNT